MICFNKSDIVSEEEAVHLMEIYEKCVNQVLSISTKEKIGLSDLQKLLEGKTTVLAGPSGVGKSSTLNELYTCLIHRDLVR